MAGINHVTGEWWWIPGTRGLKRGCPMKDGKIDNKNKNKMRKCELVRLPLEDNEFIYWRYVLQGHLEVHF